VRRAHSAPACLSGPRWSPPCALVVAIADHQSTPVVVDLVGELLHIRRHLGLQRRGQHLPRTVTHDLVDQRPEPGCAAIGLLAAPGPP
jgi:hypothetical protein